MALRIIGNPGRYVQGAGALTRLCAFAEKLGDKLFILVSASGKERVSRAIESGARAAGCGTVYEIFGGECCEREIERVGASFRRAGTGVVVGVGGGKVLDTAKAAAFYAAAPVITVPTVASTDAPCSALSVINFEDGAFNKLLFLPSNPNIVLVDTDIIRAAPVRTLVAGMGDALATYFEARACARAGAITCMGGKTAPAALALARACYDTLRRDGPAAKRAVERRVCTEAVENIIEANTYLSGVGFESGGVAAAHAIGNGLFAIEGTHGMYHGEKVAFGTLAQLVLENSTEEIQEVLGFCASVGLPTTLAALGAGDASEEELREAAVAACADGSMSAMPFEVTPAAAIAAIVRADALGGEARGKV
ncbi:MAG: iron-containing alcohol dehydrogenase [Clostridiales Family XIII bacterium]|jgi:glycerol dehydrogenase|nr:iron-containing alcohol dehydrogenase [Clostridiales Family XIII bacterium]